MKSALVITWTTPIPGREKETFEYAREADEFWGKQAAEGHCSEPEWFWASRGLSVWTVKAETEQLYAMMMMPEAQRLLAKGRLLVQDFEYDILRYGREEVLGPFEAIAKELHFA